MYIRNHVKFLKIKTKGHLILKINSLDPMNNFIFMVEIMLSPLSADTQTLIRRHMYFPHNRTWIEGVDLYK